MSKDRRKVIIAGPLWIGTQYSTAYSSDPGTRREAKALISTPARESLNARLSWQKLMLILACNFESTDLVVTLTYADAHLPAVREEADKRLGLFLRHLRQRRKSRGQALRYVRATEGYHSGDRLHHHLVINATGDDYADIRALWKWGENVEITPFGGDGFERWAKYLTKEPREKGRRHVGDRSWRASVRMKKPIVSYEFVPSSQALESPPGSVIIDRAECQNSYGRFVTLTAVCKN